jgi:hypothetical protein
MRMIEVDDKLAARMMDAIDDFASIAGELRRINKRLDRSEGREVQEALDLAALTAKVQAGTTLDESIKALVEGLAEEIDSAPTLAALRDALKAHTDPLLAAVRANTSV